MAKPIALTDPVPEATLLETVPVATPKLHSTHLKVTLSTPEFACQCPITGGNDFGTITITYIPCEKLLELAACWKYLEAYKAVPLFHEHVAQQILDDVVEAVDPLAAEVTTNFPPSALCQAPIRVITVATWSGKNLTSVGG